MIEVKVLKGFDPFKGLDDSELVKIAELCQSHEMHEGEYIFKEGTRAKELHLCRSGKVDLYIWVSEPWNKSVWVRDVRPGQLFGWSSLVSPYTYTASAECVESGEDIRIKGSDMLDLFDQHLHIGYIIMKNIGTEVSERMLRIRRRLSTEWLTSGSSVGSSIWGEPGKR